ncbi:DUF1697 domain-containing protein [Alteromonadaceae bacterium BrNp21-10]|nr:DUF1697 domain-containing protein [Alteromonadaceae bacterium BrNp21-10]
MNTYIVLLRGINVGGKNLLSMKELTRILSEAGFNNVKTYIQSGNVVLDGVKNPGDDVASLIESNFGFRPALLSLSKNEFELCIANNPYQGVEGKCVHFYFCKGNPTLNKTKLAQLAAETERYALIGHVFYLHAPNGIGRSKLVANIEACLGVSATGRNLNTISKVQRMLQNI